ncbi:hypothetical protein B0H13DRAFT_1867551 [Mycena leptocephala]|nr:hypothetical protein B0H13DRAFT_1867551 [Mycena leptocephala]
MRSGGRVPLQERASKKAIRFRAPRRENISERSVIEIWWRRAAWLVDAVKGNGRGLQAEVAMGIKMVLLWQETVDAARGRHGAVGGTEHGGGAVKDASKAARRWLGDGIAASAREEATKVTPGMGNEGEEWRSAREGETVSERAVVQAGRATGVTDKGCGRARAVEAEFGEQGDDDGHIGEKELPRILDTSAAVHLGLRMPTAYARNVYCVGCKRICKRIWWHGMRKGRRWRTAAPCAADGGGAARHPTGALKQGSGRGSASALMVIQRARGAASSELGRSEQWRDGGDAGHGGHSLQVLQTPVMVWRMTQAHRASWECDQSALCVRGADKATREVRYQREAEGRGGSVGLRRHYRRMRVGVLETAKGCARGSGKPQLPPVVAGVVRSDPGRRGGDGHQWRAGRASRNAGAAK